jgi:HEAT repeat protein
LITCVRQIGQSCLTLGIILAPSICSVGVPCAEAQTPARGSVQTLVDLLDIRTTAWAGTARLLALGPPVPPLLLSSGRIQEGPHGQMTARMLALAKFGEPAIPPIRQRLDTIARDSSQNAYQEAVALIRVLGSIGSPAVVALVDVAATSPDASRSGAALEQLVRIEPQQVVFGQSVSPWVFWRPEDDRVAEIRQAIVPQLPRIAELLDRLLLTPPTESQSSKRLAAYLLARWGSGDMRQRGRDVLDQLARTPPRFYEAREAARFLHRLGASSAAVRLHEIVEKVPDTYDLKDQVILQLAIALYQLGDSSYVEMLDRLVHTAAPRGLVEAISFARTTGDPALVEPLIALLTNDTETDRETITTVQGQTKHTRLTIGDLALDTLRRLTFQALDSDPGGWRAWRASHPHVDRRQLAVEWAASRTSRVTTVPMWEANAWIDAISRTAEPAILPLVAAYLSRQDLDAATIDGGQSRVSGGTGPVGEYGPAVVTLLLGFTQQGVADAHQLLAKCLSATDPRVRMYGALALAAYDRRAAIRQLAHELVSSEPWIRNQAADFLLQLGDARGIPSLIERLDSVDEAARHLACRDLRMYTQQPLPCDPHVSGDQPALDAVRWRQWWRSRRRGFRVRAREAALDQQAALDAPAVIFSRTAVATDGTVAPPGAVNIPGSITVSLRLPTGEIIASKRATAKPSHRGTFPGTELPYDGGGASAAISVRPTSRKTVVMLLDETAAPGPSVRLTASEVGYPSDGTGIDGFVRAGVPDRVPEPCAAQSAFMLEGVGDRADAPVLVWVREGRREASFYVDPRQNTLKIKPVLTLSTRRLQSAQPLQYVLVMDSRLGVTRGATEPDYLVIAVGKRPDGTYSSTIFPASQRQHGVGTLIQNANESWEWRFYALEDGPQFRSHCRAR